MAHSKDLVIAIFFLGLAIFSGSVEANFLKLTSFNWGAAHSSITNKGNDLQLVLDKTSGSGIQTKKPYLFGSIEMKIKLVSGNSSGTVTAYYISAYSFNLTYILRETVVTSNNPSTGKKHDEIDFEFLGNVSGQPYIIHTNIFTQGIGGREQQFHPWFDPTADFHNYTFHWNPTAVVWYIDSIPIRVFRNYENEGVPFPNRQGMRMYSSLWNADDWATQGGRVKIDWTKAPFRANYRQFRARACKWNGIRSIAPCTISSIANWWTSPVYGQLSLAKQGQMKSIRDKYMIYDYCKDTKRFKGIMPLECSKPQY